MGTDSSVHDKLIVAHLVNKLSALCLTRNLSTTSRSQRPPLYSVLSQNNPVHILPPYLLRSTLIIYFDLPECLLSRLYSCLYLITIFCVLCDSCEVRTESRFHFVVVKLCDSCEVRTESCFNFVVVTICDSCEVRTESCFNFVVVTICDSCEVRPESCFHFVVVTLRDSCEVRTESRFHFVMVTLCDSCEVQTESRFYFVVVKL
jgi:hypothetical protein